MVVVVMGVAGAGKTLIGSMLAAALRWTFLDGDDFHPVPNVEKMRRGIALDDADREAWLLRLNAELRAAAARGENLVLACSALRQAYRSRLAEDAGEVRFVHLEAPFDVIASRLERRPGHFFDPALLPSQFETLEPPDDAAIAIDGTLPPETIVARVRDALDI